MITAAVATLISTPKGIPLIRDPHKEIPLWKLPGGRCEPGESAIHAAIRELKEETGLTIQEQDLELIQAVPKSDHLVNFYFGVNHDTSTFQSRGNEDEEVKFFHPKDIILMTDIFENHRRIIIPTLEKLSEEEKLLAPMEIT